MSTPTEQDIIVVQDKLTTLHATLSPAQQEVLDTIIAAGLSVTAEDDDTGGFIMAPSQLELEQHLRDRVAAVREDFQRANYTNGGQPDGERTPRWDLKPLLAWFRRTEPRPA